MNADCTRIPPRYPAATSFRAVPFILTSMAIGCAAVVLFLFNPAQHSFYPFCFFYRTTGLLCPGCGSLRALHQLLHGNFTAALRFNALLVGSLPVAGFFLGRFVVRKLKGRPAPAMFPSTWVFGVLTVMMVFGILRNLPFARSAWLAP
jgi:hypothetical protein